MSLKNKLKNTVLGLTVVGSMFLASCDDGYLSKKADYSLKKSNVQTLDTVPSQRILLSIDDYVAKAKEFSDDIRKPAPDFIFGEDLENYNAYIINSWDSVAQNQYNAIVLSNYLQERARQENELKRFDEKKINALEDASLEAYKRVLKLPFNPLNQQVAKGQSIDVNYWDKSFHQLKTTTILFEGDAYLGYYDNKILFFPPEPRVIFGKFPSQFSQEIYNSEFKYDAQSKMTLGEVLSLMEKNVKD